MVIVYPIGLTGPGLGNNYSLPYSSFNLTVAAYMGMGIHETLKISCNINIILRRVVRDELSCDELSCDELSGHRERVQASEGPPATDGNISNKNIIVKGLKTGLCVHKMSLNNARRGHHYQVFSKVIKQVSALNRHMYRPKTINDGSCRWQSINGDKQMKKCLRTSGARQRCHS